MIVNLARLGKSGTGMWVYSIRFIDVIYRKNMLDGIICTKYNANYFKRYGCEIITVPDAISNTSKVSSLRPFLWWIYSYILSFKINRKFKNHSIVSTTHHALPFIRNQVITIHDLRPYFHPDSFIQKFYFRRMLPKTTRKINRILTVSYSVKEQIVNKFNIKSNSVGVIYNSVDVDEFKFKLGKEKRGFLLSVGASWKHKNIHSFLLNYKLWKDSYNLVIVCGETSYFQENKKFVVEYNLQDVVEFKHGVSFDHLKELYSDCSALIYPSIDEGFGIPPLEAFSSGTPAIVSDIRVFREILNDKAIFVNFDKEESVLRALDSLSLITDDDRSALKNFASDYNVDKMKDMIDIWLDDSKIV